MTRGIPGDLRHLRIVVVAPPFYEVPPQGYGGVERVCALLVDGLAARGHDVTLVAAGRQHTLGRFGQTLPVAPGEGTDDDVGVELLHAARTVALVASIQPDIVHHHARTTVLTPTACRASLATVHLPVSGPESQADLYRTIGRRMPLVAISKAQRSVDDLAWVGQVYNGIDVTGYPYREQKEPFVLFLGRLSSAKGVDQAVGAARQAGVPLVVAGAPTTPAERRWADAALQDAEGDVAFVGEVSGRERLDLLSRAACLLHPSRWEEPFGLAVVEALACGTPVVVSAQGALPELVTEGETGVVCRDPESMAPAILRAMRLETEACRRRVLTTFTADRMVDGYLAIYQQLLRGSTGP